LKSRIATVLAVLRCAILAVGGVDPDLNIRTSCLPRSDPMKRRKFITLPGAEMIAESLAVGGS
jgi:hypothetical protein